MSISKTTFARRNWPDALTAILLTAMTIACAAGADAQRRRDPIEVTAMAAWGFQGSVSTYEGELDLQNEWTYGGMLDIPVQADMSVELMYNYTKVQTTIERAPYYTPQDLVEMAISYYHGGVMYNRPLKKNLVGFTTMTLGATTFSPQESSFDTETVFSIAMGLGAKFYMGDRLGIRLGARFMLPILWASGGLWCGSGGCGAAVSGGSSIPALDLGGGLILRL
jgi:hypothetical protein